MGLQLCVLPISTLFFSLFARVPIVAFAAPATCPEMVKAPQVLDVAAKERNTPYSCLRYVLYCFARVKEKAQIFCVDQNTS
ncbi:hypothetical protein D3C76_324710 [compost metagenome]